jgi:hypothetical protein
VAADLGRRQARLQRESNEQTQHAARCVSVCSEAVSMLQVLQEKFGPAGVAVTATTGIAGCCALLAQTHAVTFFF